MSAATGDYVICKREDGKYDLSVIAAGGERESRRPGHPLADLATAHDVARAGLEDSGGTKVWVCDHSSPDVLTAYRL